MPFGCGDFLGWWGLAWFGAGFVTYLLQMSSGLSDRLHTESCKFRMWLLRICYRLGTVFGLLSICIQVPYHPSRKALHGKHGGGDSVFPHRPYARRRPE